MAFRSSLPAVISASMAPSVSSGHSAKLMLALLSISVQAEPAALGVLAEGVLEAGRGGDLAVLEERGVLVALEIQRRDHTLVELGALLQHGLRRFKPGVFKTGQLRHLVDARQVLDVEQHVLEGGGVAHVVSRN